jgi:hypothetical protein
MRYTVIQQIEDVTSLSERLLMFYRDLQDF